MIERQYGQRHLGEIFLKDSIDDCWEPWMKKADEILDDEELIDTVYEALRRRRPKSATRGRKGTPAEVATRMLVLKHMPLTATAQTVGPVQCKQRLGGLLNYYHRAAA